MRTSPVVAAAVLVSLLGACGADEIDFRRAAQEFIVGDAVEAQAGTTFTGAACESPPSTSTGTGFSCVAQGADGRTWDFRVEITGSKSFEVTSLAPR